MAAGLSAAYFGAYFICPLTISGYILCRTDFRVTFMVGESKRKGWAQQRKPSLANTDPGAEVK